MLALFGDKSSPSALSFKAVVVLDAEFLEVVQDQRCQSDVSVRCGPEGC